MNMFFRRRLMMSQSAKEYVFNETGCVTFEALENTTIRAEIAVGLATSRYASISYSLDGINWVTTDNIDSTKVTVTAPAIKKGQKISWKGSGTSSGLRGSGTRFYSTGKVNVYGHLTSMFEGENYTDTTSAADNFPSLFAGVPIVSAANLILPTAATTRDYKFCFENCVYLEKIPVLPTSVYIESLSGMFKGCTSLTSAEVLVQTLYTNSCSSMFQGCSNLNHIKAMFTTTPSSTYTNNWVSGVAANGTFVMNSAAEWNPEDCRGVSGVPSNWSIEYETA